MSSLSCAAYAACDTKILSKAIFYCIQCDSLQCVLCEKQIHDSSNNRKHERLNSDEIDGEYCSINRNHPAVFYCSTCTLLFCYSCYKNKHQHSDGREHKLQKSKEEQMFITEKDKAHSRIEAKPIYPHLPSNDHNNNSHKQNNYKNTSAFIFADIELDDYDENYISPSEQQNNSKQTKMSTATISQQKQNTNHIYKREKFNEQISDTDCQQNPLNTNSNGVFLLLDAHEHLTVKKFNLLYCYSYLSAPTKMLTEMVADQVAPSYWVPNKDVHECSSCKLVFGSDHSKHHCRACGHVFCDTCTTSRRIVPWIDTEKPVRVCDKCYANPQSRPPSATQNSSSSLIEKDKSDNQKTKQNGYDVGSSGDSASTASSVSVDIPASRRVYETVKSGLEKIGVNYPIELIKESTRPNYWRPDHECRLCFICKRAFNSTTNRLHHCRNCGDAVCEQCSPKKRPVPERDWLTPVRVCKFCDESMNESTSGHK
ncbi:unnamed protein product [Rotaria sordida]|uniref:Zinc finger protein n=1 Tax=Rotaria sordida TaxID=392033 RepID=A0A813RP99_9BILA|nr:unnamed protein product [Rotaria sordida]